MPYKIPGVYVEKKTYVGQPDIDTRCLTGFVGITERGELNKPVLIHSVDEYKEHFGELASEGNLPYSVASFFQNGGEECMVVRIANTDQARCSEYNIETDTGTLNLKAKTVGTWADSIKLSSWREGDDYFSLTLQRGKQIESFVHLSYDKQSDRYFERYINEHSNLVDATVTGKVDSIDPILYQNFSGGDDGLSDLVPGDFIGHYNGPDDYSGLSSFEHFDDIKLINIPDLNLFKEDFTSIFTVQYAMIEQAERFNNRFAILEIPNDLTVPEACEWARCIDSAFAACYYPNISAGKDIPAGGAICGSIAKNDREKGIYLPPAGQVLQGVGGMSKSLSKPEMELLYSNNVNFFKNVQGQGLKVWGCRTLSSDKEWNMINVRRTFSAICRYLKDETRWAVFENNNTQLQKRLTRYVTAFLLKLWQKGYLHGRSADEAFYVRCDEETNPPENIDLGIISFEVGVSIVRPLEFFRISFSADKNGSNVFYDE